MAMVGSQSPSHNCLQSPVLTLLRCNLIQNCWNNWQKCLQLCLRIFMSYQWFGPSSPLVLDLLCHLLWPSSPLIYDLSCGNYNILHLGLRQDFTLPHVFHLGSTQTFRIFFWQRFLPIFHGVRVESEWNLGRIQGKAQTQTTDGLNSKFIYY